MKKVTTAQGRRALKEVARQLGGVPTGPDAAYHGNGPELNMTWAWPGQPTPTILLESSAFTDWAITIDHSKVNKAAGVFCEPYAGYALCLYPPLPNH